MQIPQLTFLRFVAATFVVILHFGINASPFNWGMLQPVFAAGALGVPFFFTLSGFLLAWVYAVKPTTDWRAYTRARVARIAPMYYLAFFLSLALLLFSKDAQPSAFYFVLQLLGLHAWVPDYSLTINFPAWTISIELFLYLLFPFLLNWLRKQTGWVLLIVAVIPWGFGYFQMEYCNSWTSGWLEDPFDFVLLRFPLWHVNSFLVGMCGGLYLLRNPHILQGKPWHASAVIFACTVLLIAACYFPESIIRHSWNGLLSPIYLLVLVAFTQDKGFLSYLFSLPALVFLGEASYALYLLQFPWYLFLQLILPANAFPYFNGMWFALYFVTLLAMASLLHLGFERPCRKWINALGNSTRS